MPLTLLHFGDIHLWRLGFDADFYIKRVLGIVNLIVRRRRRFPVSAAAAVAERIAAEQADYVLFSGDLTTTSLRAEFDAARRLLQPILDSWGERFIAIPGNHDRYTPRSTNARLFETLFTGDSCMVPLARDLNEHWTLIRFDCSIPRPFASYGCLTPALLRRLGELLDEHRRRDRRLIVMGHYPLAYPPVAHIHRNHALPGRERLLELFESHGVSLYLHGHVHNRWCFRAGSMVHLNCGSAGYTGRRPERRPGYLKLRLTPEGLQSAEAHYFMDTWQTRELCLE